MNTEKDLNNILLKFSLKLIKYINSQNIIVEDTIGYKYKINMCNIKVRDKLPHLFRGNPYAINNIKKYLSVNNTGLILVSQEYIDCKHKLQVICQQHQDKGVQYKTLDEIINNNQYCKYCSIEKRSESRRISIDIIKERCEELNLIYVDKYIKNQETWVSFKCKTHLGKGIQNIAWSHLKTCAVGCVYCTGRHKTTKDFVEEMRDINANIEVIGEYIGSESPILCKCRICGHEWSPIGRSLKYGQGCPICVSSKGEIQIKHLLDNYGIEYIRQKTFDDCVYKDKLRFDFYLTQYHVLIEFDGIQHYQPVDFANKGEEWATEQFRLTQIKDKIKNNYCEDHHIKLIRIPYWELDNIITILASEISDAF